jgi:hypothetical protein
MQAKTSLNGLRWLFANAHEQSLPEIFGKNQSTPKDHLL